MGLVSIIVPCYNQVHFLKECLESIRVQTFRDWECIVVDDVSTEGNPSEIVKAMNDDRMSCVRHDKNKGLAASRNTGIKLSTTKFIATIDSDDTITPDFIDMLLNPLLKDASYDCAFGDIQLFGQMQGLVKNSLKEYAFITRHQWIPGAGVIMRKILWKKVGGYSESEILRAGNEDWEFWLSAVEKGLKVIHVPKPMYCYRKYTNSMSDQLRSEDYKTRELMYARHKELFDRTNASRYFLYCGYKNSAFALKMEGNYNKSLKLYLESLTRTENYYDSISIIYEALTPRFVYKIFYYMKSMIKIIICYKKELNIKIYRSRIFFI